MNSQQKSISSKGDFVLKNRFETFDFKISGIQNKFESKIYIFYKNNKMSQKYIFLMKITKCGKKNLRYI